MKGFLKILLKEYWADLPIIISPRQPGLFNAGMKYFKPFIEFKSPALPVH